MIARLFRRNTRVPRIEGNPRRPVSNVRVGYVLTPADFWDCEDCASGKHGLPEDDRPTVCRCCRWEFSFRAGSFIEARS